MNGKCPSTDSAAAQSSSSSGLSGLSAFDVGARPEDVQFRTSPEPGWTEARVDVLEPVGNETIVMMTAAGRRVVARAAAEMKADPGQPVWFRVAPDRAHFFDRSSGKRLSDG